MRLSLIRFQLVSVLGSWTLFIFIIILYFSNSTWSQEKAKNDGVFLMYDTLSSITPDKREETLAKIQDNFGIPFSIETSSQVESLWNIDVATNTVTHHRVSFNKHVYVLTFSDSSQALVAGPINPAFPGRTFYPNKVGVFPLGGILGLLGILLLSVLNAFLIESSFRKIEKVNEAILEGDLSTRIDEKTPFMKEYAVRFNKMAMRIEQLVQEKDELIQAVSHELGSPLSRVRLHLSLMHQSTESIEKRAAKIVEEMDRLDELIIELMDYVQPPQVNKQAFDPIQIIKESAELALLNLNKLELDFEIQHHSNTPFQIIADPKLFQRVMDNLIRNAVAHTNKQLVVEIVDNQEHIGIFVHDDGIGIPQEHRDKVFEPFFRLKPEGTGLGLAIVHRIIHKHTGLLSIDTSFLGGAVVQVFWKKG